VHSDFLLKGICEPILATFLRLFVSFASNS